MKLYVLVRKDLSPTQQAVQAGHAVGEYCLNYPARWSNGTLVYLGVKSKIQLENWVEKLKRLNKHFIEFREPDLDFQVTSIASVTDDNVFRNLQLLKL